MGRYKTKLQAVQEANKRILKEDSDEFKRQPGSMADSDEWVGKEKDPYDGWRQLKRMLYDHERKMDGKQLEEHIKNLKSHLQELTYVLKNQYGDEEERKEKRIW